MCGIVGIVDDRVDAAALQPTIRAMNDVVIHRGPDDEGFFVNNGIALAMRRLSIIDLAGGKQPIWNERRDVVVVFNGEIYNYRELTEELKGRGHSFGTNCDTEVLVHLYEEHGSACVDRLRGMFSFAIWDLRKRQLFVARDRLGIKPLYYYVDGRQLIFGSEIKSLLRHPDVIASLDIAALNHYLTFKYVPAPQTLFTGIQSLPPGHRMLWHDGKLRIQQYWDLHFDQPSSGDDEPITSDEAAIDRLSHLLRESVRLRLRSDVPFGAFLSGGIDSSLIVAMMSSLLDQPVKTFSIGFDTNGRSRDELPFARQVAREFGTEHHEIKIRPEDFATHAQRVIWHMDQPIADQATVATLMLAEMARQHVKMVLTGEGGDELFAGYARYSGERASRAFNAMPRFAKQAMLKAAGRIRGRRRAKIALYALCQSREVTRFTNWFPLFNHDAKQSVFAPELRERFPWGSSDAIFQTMLAQTSAKKPLHRMLYVDTKHWLSDFLLLRGDKLTMASSLEARVPLLDHRLVEFATRLPPRMKVRGSQRKYLLKQLALRHLPPAVVNRKKQGFPIPIHEWFRGESRSFLRDLLDHHTVARRGLFEPSQVDLLMNQHESGFADHSSLIWGLASIEIWHQLFIDPGSSGAGSAAPAPIALASAQNGKSHAN